METTHSDMALPLPTPEYYDLIVIGSGSGNTIIDDRFAQRKVALIDHGVFGGTCLNRGCIPTKMFIYPAEVMTHARRLPKLGIDATIGQARWDKIRDRIFARIDPLSDKALQWRESNPNVDVFADTAAFIGPRTVKVGTRILEADHIVIATGSQARMPNVEGYDESASRIHTSDSIMRIEKLPRSIIIIGGGAVAAEFAYLFSAFGVQTAVISHSERMLMAADEEISRAFTHALAERARVGLRQRLTRYEARKNGITVYTEDEVGTEYEYDADLVLVAQGREPNSAGLDLGYAGVQTDADGFIVVDEYQRTTAEGIYALGDVCSPRMLKHVANRQARTVAYNVLHPANPRPDTLTVVPAAIFTDPEIAVVGLTEKEARATGRTIAVGKKDYADVAFGWAMEIEPGCFAKVIIDADTLEILGAHIIGPHAALLMQPLITALTEMIPADRLGRGEYWIHPGLAEVVENAVLDAVKNAGRTTD